MRHTERCINGLSAAKENRLFHGAALRSLRKKQTYCSEFIHMAIYFVRRRGWKTYILTRYV